MLYPIQSTLSFRSVDQLTNFGSATLSTSFIRIWLVFCTLVLRHDMSCSAAATNLFIHLDQPIQNCEMSLSLENIVQKCDYSISHDRKVSSKIYSNVN